jgi:hypothetical protein
MSRTATKPRAKKVKVQQPRIRKSLLQDPSWEGVERWNGEKFSRNMHHARQYYLQNYATNDLIDFTYEWMGRQERYTRHDIRAAKAAKTKLITTNVGVTARMLSMGMPDVHEKYNEWWTSLKGTGDNTPRPFSEFVIRRIGEAIADGKEILKTAKIEETKKINVHVPSIQERIRETCGDMVVEIEEFLDQFMRSPDSVNVVDFDPLTLLRRKQAKPGHARVIKKWYQGEYDEFQELANLPTPAQMKKFTDEQADQIAQLKEGYAHLSVKQRKDWLSVFQKIMDACEILDKEAKTQRAPRKVKAKSPEDQVKSLKFKISESKYGIASVPPAKIIGASVAVVFNVKTRKLGIYYASNTDPKGLQRVGTGFSVKSTTLQGFDTERSVQKTLRKPEEQLTQVKKTTRAKAEKFLETVSTTETKLNGRFNEDVVLLAVY